MFGTKCLTPKSPDPNDLRIINLLYVAPAKAGVQGNRCSLGIWIPAFAGTTNKFLIFMDSFPVRL